MDFLKKIRIQISPLLGKGIALFLFSLTGYILFYFAVFSRNPISFLGLVLIVLFSFFFFEYAFYAFVFTLPLLSEAPKLLNLPPFSPSDLLFLCLLNAFVLKMIFKKEKVIFLRRTIDLPIIIFAFVIIGSLLSSSITHYPLDYFYAEKVTGVLKRLLFIHNPYDYSYVFKSTFKILEGLCCYFIVTNVFAKERAVNRIYFLVVLGWVIALLLGFLQYFGKILGYERWPMEMFSMFSNPNLFGGYLILIFPFSILYAIDKSFFKRISLSILAMISVVALILSRSANSWVAFSLLLILIGIYFLMSFLKKRGPSTDILNRKRVAALMISFVIVLGFLCLYLARAPLLGLVSEDMNLRVPIEQKLGLRLPLWKHTFQIVEDFPLWGGGIGEFNFVFQKYSSGRLVSDVGSYQAHNYFLQVAVEIGLIGLCAFLWILEKIIKRGFHIMKGGRDVKKLGLWFGIIGFIFTFFGDGYLWNIEMILMFFVFVGVLFVDVEGNEMAQSDRRSSDRRLLIGLSVVIFLTIPFQIYQRSQFSFLPEKSIGLYKEVFNEEGKEYRWGEKVVLIPLEKKGKRVQIPIRLGNPDIEKRPVKVKIFINRKLIEVLEFNDNNWHILKYSLEDIEGTEIRLKLEAGRTWNPYLTDGTLYPWDLGPAIGKIYWSS